MALARFCLNAIVLPTVGGKSAGGFGHCTGSGVYAMLGTGGGAAGGGATGGGATGDVRTGAGAAVVRATTG